MRDNNLLVSDAAVAADAFSANAIELDTTPVSGVWLQFHITRNGADADETLDITVYGKDTNSAWATTDDPVAILDQVADGDVASGASINKYVLVQTKHTYIKPYYNVAGTTPSFDIVCAVVTGPERQTGA